MKVYHVTNTTLRPRKKTKRTTKEDKLPFKLRMGIHRIIDKVRLMFQK